MVVAVYPCPRPYPCPCPCPYPCPMVQRLRPRQDQRQGQRPGPHQRPAPGQRQKPEQHPHPEQQTVPSGTSIFAFLNRGDRGDRGVRRRDSLNPSRLKGLSLELCKETLRWPQRSLRAPRLNLRCGSCRNPGFCAGMKRPPIRSVRAPFGSAFSKTPIVWFSNPNLHNNSSRGEFSASAWILRPFL
jgi:hypothetical protein